MANPKVTIYSKSPLGSISKVEGVLTGVDYNGVGGQVSFLPKGGRRERGLMTYYSPFILVVEGWGKPDPDSGYLPAEPSTNPNVSVSRGRYRSQDPRWISDFMEGPGKTLRPLVLFENGHLVKDNSGLKEASLHEKILRFATELPKGSAERKTLLHLLATERQPRAPWTGDE